MEPTNKEDVLVREWDDSSEMGAWIGKAEYETPTGDTYTVCQNQNGEEWVEE